MNGAVPAEVLEAGHTLAGRYVIESVLGRGGMGSVYLAHMTALGKKPVAIKEMRFQVARPEFHPQAIEQFHREAQFLARLEHPNLVDVTDFFEEEGRHYLVMSYIGGKTLLQLLQQRKGAFTVEKVLDWGLQLCAVLDYLHSQKPPILFRDLKPANIMLDNHGKIRLIDFGIARVFEEEGVTATFLQGVGSAGYAPLEQYQGAGGTDPRSDIYSLGATLYHLLTNRQPPSPAELVSEGKEIPSPRTWNPTLPPALEQVLMRMLRLRKDERYPAIAPVREAFTRILKELERAEEDAATEVLTALPTALAAETTRTMPESSSPDRSLWLTALGLGAVLLGFGAWLWMGGSPTPQGTPRPQALSSPSAPASAVVGQRPTPAPSASTESRPGQSLPVRPAAASRPLTPPPKPRPPVVTSKPNPPAQRPAVPVVDYPKAVPTRPRPVPVPAEPMAQPVLAASPAPIATPAPAKVETPSSHPVHIPGSYPPGWKPGDPHPPPLPHHHPPRPHSQGSQRPPGY